jgi:hypothetical protein
MNVQVPTPTNLHPGHTPALVAALAAAAIAGGTIGVIAIATNDDNSAQAPSPVVSKVAPDRVLDGSPILRGTAQAVDPNRVLDGSPLVRGSAATSSPSGFAYRHAIAPKSLRKSSSVQGTLRRPSGQYGFGNAP